MFEVGDRVLVDSLVGQRPGTVEAVWPERVKVRCDDGSLCLVYIESVSPEV